MLSLSTALHVICLVACFSYSFAASDSKINVEHSIDGEKYVSRGQLVLQSNLRDSSSKGLTLNDDFDLLTEAFQDIENAPSYRIRFPVLRVASGEIQTGGSLQGYVDGFLPIDYLKGACYAHEIHLYIDQLGTLFGASVLPLTCANYTVPTNIRVFQTESATGPDTKAFIQKIEEERARKARTPVDNRSFFQKYWLYIVVGIFAFTLLSGANAPQGGGEGGA